MQHSSDVCRALSLRAHRSFSSDTVEALHDGIAECINNNGNFDHFVCGVYNLTITEDFFNFLFGKW